MSKLVNTSKHISVVRSAIKRLKSNNEEHQSLKAELDKRISAKAPAEKIEEAEESVADFATQRHMFYMIRNRKSKVSLLHIDLKAGKPTGPVKNPKAIRIHLQKAFSDKKEATMKSLVGGKTLTDADLKKLVSCAGYVTMRDNIMDFAIENKAGKGTAGDLNKMLALGDLKKLIPPGYTVNGARLDEAGATDNQEEGTPTSTRVNELDVSGLATMMEDFENKSPEQIQEAMAAFEEQLEERGLTFDDLSDMNPVPAGVQKYIEQADKDFQFSSDGSFESEESVFEFVAELMRDAWDHNLRDKEGIEEELDTLNDLLEPAFWEGKAESTTVEFTSNGRTKKYTREQLQELQGKAEEAMLILDFGDPDVLERRFYSIEYHQGLKQEVDTKQRLMNTLLLDAATLEDVMVEDDGTGKLGKKVVLENGEQVWFYPDMENEGSVSLEERVIASPIPSELPREQKLMLIKMMTDKNYQKVQDLCNSISNDVELEGCSAGASRKKPETIESKSERPDVKDGKDWLGVEHIRDTFRFKAVVKHFNQLPGVFQKIVNQGIQLVKMDTEKFLSPKGFGWRIIAFDLRMPYNNQIVEWYIPISDLEKAKKGGGHQIFEDWRNKSDEEREAQKEQYDKAKETSSKLYNTAFQNALINMGYVKGGSNCTVTDGVHVKYVQDEDGEWHRHNSCDCEADEEGMRGDWEKIKGQIQSIADQAQKKRRTGVDAAAAGAKR